MSVSVQSVINRVQATLQDAGGIRFPVISELVLWVNDCQREIALLKPDATAVNATVTLVTGTKQSIPVDGNRLLSVVRNMSAASSGTGKRAVRLVQREALDSQTPDWHNPTATGSASHGVNVKHYIYDDEDPRNFYVYPGVSGSAFMEIVYSANPATVALNENLGVPDIYANAVMNYVIYMACMKDSEAGNQSRAGAHYQLFQIAVTGKGQLDATANPNVGKV